MSNEYKDWLWDKFSDTLLNANVIDKVIQIIPSYGDYAATVHGIKDGIHVKYTVAMDDDGNWYFEQEEI